MTTVAHPHPVRAAVSKGGVFALGNFDGVHLGHQAVVKAALEKSRALNVLARVLTLEPHPRSVLKPGIAPFRLTPAPVKERLLHALGIEDVIVQAFTPEFSQLSGQDFVQKILIDEFGAQHVMAGFDFVFGHNRDGNMTNLRQWLAPHNVGVTEVAPFRDAHGEVMSATRAREALRQGDLATTAHILGRPWAIGGTVVRGSGRGGKIGVPTANIALGEYLRPKFGVYAVRARRVGAAKGLPAIANIGVRPTFDGAAEGLEVHIFDFNEDIYGQEWEAELQHFLRPERKFASVEALRAQIAQDIDDAKARLRP